MLNWLFLLVPLMTHWYSFKHKGDFLQQRTTKVLTVGLIMTNRLPQFSVKLYQFFKRQTFCLLLTTKALWCYHRGQEFPRSETCYITCAAFILDTPISDKTNGNFFRNSFLFFIKCRQDRKNALLSVLTSLVLCCLGGFIVYWSNFIAVKQHLSHKMCETLTDSDCS